MKTAKIYQIVALIFAIWFLLTSWMWAYLINLFVSLPAGLMSLILWHRGRTLNPGHPLNKIIVWILIAGIVLSLGILLFFTWGNWG